MTPPRTENDESLWRAWGAAAAAEPVDAALRGLYERLDRAIAERGPTCWLSGRCCHFDRYGHRLYATGLEIAWLARQLDAAARKRLDEADLPHLDGCPFQVEGLCTVHGLRPLGCRIYFCDPSAQAWQNDLYERFLTRLGNIHESHAIPYRYMEWRRGLRDARLAQAIGC